jgi:hypothetical protein
MFLNGTCCLASCVSSVSNDRVPGVAQSMQLLRYDDTCRVPFPTGERFCFTKNAHTGSGDQVTSSSMGVNLTTLLQLVPTLRMDFCYTSASLVRLNGMCKENFYSFPINES